MKVAESRLKVREAQVFIDEEEIKRKILVLMPKEARGMGIKYRSTLKKMKDRIISGKNINYKTKEVIKLISYLLIN